MTRRGLLSLALLALHLFVACAEAAAIDEQGENIGSSESSKAAGDGGLQTRLERAVSQLASECPPASRKAWLEALSFDELNNIMKGFKVDDNAGKIGVSTNGCLLLQPYTQCKNPSGRRRYWTTQNSQTATQYAKFCDTCNSFDASTMTEAKYLNHGLQLSQHTDACVQEPGTKFCSIQACGKTRIPSGGTPSSMAGIKGFFYNVKHGGSTYDISSVSFRTQCGKKQKLTVCVMNSARVLGAGKLCVVKKKCAPMRKMGLNSFYRIRKTRRRSRHLGYLRPNRWADKSTAVRGWLDAFNASDMAGGRTNVDKFAELQCEFDCALY